jgi:uncharacterized protein (TIGR00251 family)
VKVVPRASKPGISAAGGTLRVRLQAPPVDGAANTELIEVLASAFGLAKRAVSIVAGAHSRTKRVRLEGIDATAVAAVMARAAE